MNKFLKAGTVLLLLSYSGYFLGLGKLGLTPFIMAFIGGLLLNAWFEEKK